MLVIVVGNGDIRVYTTCIGLYSNGGKDILKDINFFNQKVSYYLKNYSYMIDNFHVNKYKPTRYF